MNRRQILKTLLTAPLAISPIFARAWIVFDPTNFIQNIMTAAESIKATADRAIQIKVQYEQYEAQLKQLKGLDPRQIAQMAAGNSKQIQDLQKYIQAANKMYGSVQKVRKVMQNRFDEAKLSNLPFDEYMNVVKERIDAGVKDAAERAEGDRRALERVNEDYKEVLEWQGTIGKTEGLHQAQQLMNAQMSRLVTQNAEVIKMMASSRLQEASNEINRSKEEEIARQQTISARQGATKALDRSREELERWNRIK